MWAAASGPHPWQGEGPQERGSGCSSVRSGRPAESSPQDTSQSFEGQAGCGCRGGIPVAHLRLQQPCDGVMTCKWYNKGDTNVNDIRDDSKTLMLV